MYRFHNLGLYCHYAGIGFGYGIAGIALNCKMSPPPRAIDMLGSCPAHSHSRPPSAPLLFLVCFYFYEGSDNVCADAPSLIFLAWGFKIFYAIMTDRWRPFGSRRRVYMTWGWMGAIGCTLVLALIGDTCSVSTWLGLSIATQACMMLADVPADGGCPPLLRQQSPDLALACTHAFLSLSLRSCRR